LTLFLDDFGLVLTWSGHGSPTKRPPEALWTHEIDSEQLPTLLDLLPVSIAPNTAPAVAGAVFLMVLLLVLGFSE